MRLLVATTNANKVREIRAAARRRPVRADHPRCVCPPFRRRRKPGAPSRRTRAQKALYYAAATGELTVAEDSGLEIDALGGAPGVESARFGGVDDVVPGRSSRCSTTRCAQRPRPGSNAARFVCALALARGERVVFEARGTVEGRIAPEPKGDGGFGYDPIFFYPPYGRTLAEVPQAQKSVVSHRGAAFRKLREFLSKVLGSKVLRFI